MAFTLWNSLLLASVAASAFAINLNVDDPPSIKAAASTIATDMMNYYWDSATGQIHSGIPGYLIASNYYWWECGAMFGSMIDYWKYTGDTTHNSLVANGLQFQIGPDADFMPPNASKWMGNDDQGFWALSAMSAAENNFPEPTGATSWLALAQAVFNEQTLRWDSKTCGGGMRWQAYSFLAGWDLKNSISNGIYFQLGARLARFTGNDTYARLAERTYSWMESVKLVDSQFNVYDNSQADTLNCTRVDHTQWTYNAATMLVGSAYMYNLTNGSTIWKSRTNGILNQTLEYMFPGGIMTEVACEPSNTCNADQHSFKAYLSRWMALTSQLAPFTYDTIIATLRLNAPLAAGQCIGNGSQEAAGKNIGTACGFKWNKNGTWDGSDGVGQQMSALEVVLGLLVGAHADVPLTSNTGGTSTGNPEAGNTKDPTMTLEHLPVASKADRIGAGIMTGVACICVLMMAYFLITEAGEDAARLEAALSRKPQPPTLKGKQKVVQKDGQTPRSLIAPRQGTPKPPIRYGTPTRSSSIPEIPPIPEIPRISTTLQFPLRPSHEERALTCRAAIMLMNDMPGAEEIERARSEYEKLRLQKTKDNTWIATTRLHETSSDSGAPVGPPTLSAIRFEQENVNPRSPYHRASQSTPGSGVADIEKAVGIQTNVSGTQQS